MEQRRQREPDGSGRGVRPKRHKCWPLCAGALLAACAERDVVHRPPPASAAQPNVPAAPASSRPPREARAPRKAAQSAAPTSRANSAGCACQDVSECAPGMRCLCTNGLSAEGQPLPSNQPVHDGQLGEGRCAPPGNVDVAVCTVSQGRLQTRGAISAKQLKRHIPNPAANANDCTQWATPLRWVPLERRVCRDMNDCCTKERCYSCRCKGPGALDCDADRKTRPGVGYCSKTRAPRGRWHCVVARGKQRCRIVD